MRFDIVTIFPDMVKTALAVGVVGRALEGGRLSVGVHDLRAFTTDRHRTVDDVPYGGGPGMVLKAEPLFAAVEAITSTEGPPAATVLLSPQGRTFDQAMAERLATLGHVALLCGRYEGVDERVRTGLATHEVSVGDYVVSGGELPALIVVDAVSRLVPGVVGDAASVRQESFTTGLLDFPHFTRPAEVRGLGVPDVLLSGHHEAIARWRNEQALERTRARRPDLLARAPVASSDGRQTVEGEDDGGNRDD